MKEHAYEVMKAVMELENVETEIPGYLEERKRLNSSLRYWVPELLNAVDGKLRTLVERFLAAEDELKELRNRICDHHKLSSPEVRLEVWKLTDGQCTYCGKALAAPDGDGSGDTMFIEHVIPRSKGGPDNLVNYVPACCSCNTAKSDGHVLKIIRRIQRRDDSSNVVSLSSKLSGAAE